MSNKSPFKYTANAGMIVLQFMLTNCFIRVVNQGIRHNKALPEEGRELTQTI